MKSEIFKFSSLLFAFGHENGEDRDDDGIGLDWSGVD